MSVFKPSNFYPNFEEINLNKSNTFSCQVNTSGSKIKAYKIEILSESNQILFSPNSVQLNEGDFISNKGILGISPSFVVLLTTSIAAPAIISVFKGEKYYNTTDNLIYECTTDDFGSFDTSYAPDSNTMYYDLEHDSIWTDTHNAATPILTQTMQNGKDYKWRVRVYEDVLNSTERPQTLVCKGTITGSTANVIWTNNSEKIAVDRWIQVNTTVTNGVPDNMMAILQPNINNLVYPADGAYKERRQIVWVDKELGTNKDVTKVETDEEFTYNYNNGTSFSVYQVSDQQGYNTIYVDPEDTISIGTTYIKVTSSDANYHKVLGYNEKTGEVRVQTAFTTIPVNGATYQLYSYDATTKVYTELTVISNLIGGTPITDANFIVKNNDASKGILFIQPNINIKSDATNPCELYFENGIKGVRVDITKTTSSTLIPNKIVDTTFNKLDNTQWLVSLPTPVGVSTPGSTAYPIVPQTPYTVYTSFMDSLPENLFYARTPPKIQLYYKDLDDEASSYEWLTDYLMLKPTPKVLGIRNISFQGEWKSPPSVSSNEFPLGIKSFYYILYDENKQKLYQSDVYYSDSLTWDFYGLSSGILNEYGEPVPQYYYIALFIEDEYNYNWESEVFFGVNYSTQSVGISLNAKLNCEEEAIAVEIKNGVYAESTALGELSSVTSNNIINNAVVIGNNEVLNYTKIKNENEKLVIPSIFEMSTIFQISENFLQSINAGSYKEIFRIAHQNANNTLDIYKVVVCDANIFLYNNSVISRNGEQLKIKIFKNDETTPLSCFKTSGGVARNYVSVLDLDSSVTYPAKVWYGVQDNSSGAYVIVNSLPSSATSSIIDKKLLLTSDQTIGGLPLYSGVYVWNSAISTWVQDTSTAYVLIDDITQFTGADYTTLNVPEASKNADNSTLMWPTDSDTHIVVQNVDFDIVNKKTVGTKWFNCYFSVNQSSNKNSIVFCDIKLNTKK